MIPSSRRVARTVLYWPLVMTGMTGRPRALPTQDPGAAGPPRTTDLEEQPSGKTVGELIAAESGTYKIAKSEGSSLAIYLRSLRAHNVLSREEEHELAVRYVQTHELAP